MKYYKTVHIYRTFIFIIFLVQGKVSGEPHCSKFHYEEQTLGKIIRLELQMERLQSEMENTQKRTLDMLNELKNFKEKLSTEFNSIKEQNRLDLENRSEDFRILKDSVSIPVIAFQSRNPSTTNPKTGDKIVFTDTLHDSAHSYNNKTGIFTAPVAGTYLFNVHLCLATGNKYIHYAIYIESTAVTNTLLYDASERFCNSVTAIVYIRKDDKVYIKATSANGNALRETDYEWNMFSGVLLNNK
ncbi:uncharacterized protein LOC123532038 [Mercenaria mercenaria]|uniref:uncharacterized protein LOC123532038 n=1 Tax=Mercenaria mercenaria TaxID=6596 RepID=UPI00234F2B83|nr:uncharacterized protein LOC123532038 [Mercenaria mercenaria]